MATVIDALLVTLGLDTKEFKKGEDESKKSLDNVKKHSEETAEAIAQHGERAADFFKELISGALAFIGVMKSVEGIKEMVVSTLEADHATGRLAAKMHVTTEELGGMQGAAVLADGSIQGFQQSMTGLGGALADIHDKAPRAKRRLDALTKAGVKGLQLGKRADIMDVMRQLSDTVKGLDAFSASRLLGKAGISDEGTIRLLRKGREGMAELVEEAHKFGVASEADAEAGDMQEEATNRLTLAKLQLGRIITQVVAPALTFITDLAGKISAWVNQHATAVKAGFIGIAVGIAATGLAALMASPEVLAFAAATIAATWPLLVIGAEVGSLAAGVAWLIFKYKEWDKAGGETTTKLGKFFAYIKEGWNAIKDTVFLTFDAIWEIVKLDIDMIMDYLTILFDFFTGNWGDLGKDSDKLFKDLMRYFKIAGLMITLLVLKFVEESLVALNSLEKKIKDLFATWGSRVIKWTFGIDISPQTEKLIQSLRFLSPMFWNASSLWKEGKSQYNSAMETYHGHALATAGQVNSAMMMSPMHSTQSSRTVDTHIGTINVNAPNATDAAGIGHSIHSELQQHPLVDQGDGN